MRALVTGATGFIGGRRPLRSPSEAWRLDTGVARPLVESLASETILTDPEPATAFDVRPIGCLEALRRTHQEEQTA